MYLEEGQRTGKFYRIKAEVGFEKNYDWNNKSLSGEMVKNKDKYRGRTQENMEERRPQERDGSEKQQMKLTLVRRPWCYPCMQGHLTSPPQVLKEAKEPG